MRLAALLLLVPGIACAATIERAWASWRPADYFDSIGEHLTGKEATGSEVVLRSKPDSRDGFYLLVRLNKDGATPATAALEVVAPDAHQPVVHTWQLPATVRSSQVYQFGVTGPDWPHPERLPLAWRIRLLDASGAVIATEKSFLWSAEPAP